MQDKNTGTATVCGIGAVTGYGWGRKYLWEGVTSGVPSARLTPGYGSAFDTDEVWLSPVPDGGDVTDGRGRFGRAVHAAVREAIEDATDRGWRPGEVVGMVHAIVLGEVELWRDFYLVHGMRRTRKQFIELMPSTPLDDDHARARLPRPVHGRHGDVRVRQRRPAHRQAVDRLRAWRPTSSSWPPTSRPLPRTSSPSSTSACASPTGPRSTAAGRSRRAAAASSWARRRWPWCCRRRPNGGYARVLGGAMTQDAHHVISIEPSYTQLRRCWTTGLASAGVHPARRGLPQRPRARDAPVRHRRRRLLFDEMLPAAAGVYSFKPLTGHCQGAAAAVEVALTCLAYDSGWIAAPPQVAAGHPAPACPGWCAGCAVRW